MFKMWRKDQSGQPNLKRVYKRVTQYIQFFVESLLIYILEKKQTVIINKRKKSFVFKESIDLRLFGHFQSAVILNFTVTGVCYNKQNNKFTRIRF